MSLRVNVFLSYVLGVIVNTVSYEPISSRLSFGATLKIAVSEDCNYRTMKMISSPNTKNVQNRTAFVRRALPNNYYAEAKTGMLPIVSLSTTVSQRYDICILQQMRLD